MPQWRCSHCGVPQAEAARCWVCRRSSTACVTCRNFRRAVAGELGYCGLDRRRAPLHGDEIRACWEAAAAIPADRSTAATQAPGFDRSRTDVRRLEFVPVETPLAAATQRRRRGEIAGAVSATAPEAGRWSLWGDPDF